jgi:hypothetical protein
MNIFACDPNPFLAALYILWWRHIVKMPLETAQILWTVHRLHKTCDIPAYGYKSTHVNHPCVVWAAESTANYLWLVDHFEALCQNYRKYTERRNAEDAAKGMPSSKRTKIRDHKCFEHLQWFRDHTPACPKNERTSHPLVVNPKELPRVAEEIQGKIDLFQTYRRYVEPKTAEDRANRRREAEKSKKRAGPAAASPGNRGLKRPRPQKVQFQMPAKK